MSTEAQAFTSASKRFLIGRPRATGEMGETLLSKKLALPIFASDPISSVAYATEAALAVLVAVSLSSAHYVLPISAAQAPAARTLHERLRAAGIRSAVDERSDTLNYRIRDAELHKVPYMAVVGQREADAGTAAVRARGAGHKQVVLPLDEFVAKLGEEIRTRSLAPLV